MSIYELPVIVKKKGKTRGRPSKAEIYVSKMMSEMFSSDAYKKEVERYLNELVTTGQSSFNAEKVAKSFVEEVKP